MFHATARALRTAADRQLDEPSLAGMVSSEPGEELDIALVPHYAAEDPAVGQERMRTLNAEYRWAEGNLMQASERLAEAQEARRKDLVALACMRRELKRSFTAEREYARAQVQLYTGLLPTLWSYETELDQVVAAGAAISPVLNDLASVRAERKLLELAAAQGHAQISQIDENEATLDYEVANESMNAASDGRTIRELERLRTARARAHRASLRERSEVRELLSTLEIDTSVGEVMAIASLLAAEYEGDARAHARVERVRSAQMQRELSKLPAPVSSWKAGLLSPLSWMRARRLSVAT